MVNPQLYPLEVNPRTGEPFLRVKNHKNIILTPPRPSDIACYLPILNDPRVWNWVWWPPIPYRFEHAKARFASTRARSEAVLRELEEAEDMPDLVVVNECPVRAIREVKENGEDVYLGDIAIDRWTDGRALTVSAGIQAEEEEMARCAERNIRRTVGDPKIVWHLGGHLKIMTDIVSTLLWEWAVPRMGVRRVLVQIIVDNRGSTGVLQASGFTLTKVVENYEEAGGKMIDFAFFEWNLEAGDTQSAKL